MAIYSIRDLEKLSGIKAHTLRIWESRYGIIKPKRTPTNIRYYLDEDLKLVLNIAFLNKNGFKISKIAKMSNEEIGQKVAAIADVNAESETQIDALTIAMMDLDEAKFNHIFESSRQKNGFEATILELIYPFLEKLSVLWLTGSVKPVQENFINGLIRQKMIAAIDAVPMPVVNNNPSFMLFLPPGEKQELSLLLLQYLLKQRQFRVINIGQEITFIDIVDAYGIQKPNYVFTMITETFTKQPIQTYVDSLSKQLPECEVLLTGYQVAAQPISAPDNVRLLHSLGEMVAFLDELKGK